MTRLVLAFLLAGSPVAAQESPHDLQQAFLAAIKAGDAEAIGALYAEDAVSYSIGAMEVRGPAGVRDDWASFFEGYLVEAVDIDGREEVHGDIALAWGLWTMTIRPVDGGEAEILEGRFTDISKKIDGRWRYVVDHASVPQLEGE